MADIHKRTTIRRAVSGDLDALHELELVCSRNPWTREGLCRELLNADSIFLVLENGGGQIIGFICSSLVADESQILEVAVHPDHRGRGLGAMMLCRLISDAGAKGAAKIFLEVRVSNRPAIRLYESFGFVKDGERRRYYQDGEDAALMSRPINKQ